MGQGDTEKSGYPKTGVKRDFVVLLFCGGSGGGACAAGQQATSCKFAIDVNPFIVKNNYLILENTSFDPVQFFTNAGPDGFCDNSYGSEVPWYLGFSVDGVLTDAQIIAQDIQLSGNAPYQIEIEGRKLPQPTNPSWANKIWIHIYWGSTAYVAERTMNDNVQHLSVVKHDFEVRQ